MTPLVAAMLAGRSATTRVGRSPTWRRAALATVGVLAVCIVPALHVNAASGRSVGTPVEVITPLVATPLSSPHPVLGADNRLHLVYVLFVINPTSSVMRLEKLETLDASTHDSVIGSERDSRIIATLAGEGLDGAIRPLVPVSTLTLEPAQVTRLFLDATFARAARLPRRLTHRFTFTLTPMGGSASTHTVISGSTHVHHDSPVVIGPPWPVLAG
jgi:hypothetical protein